MAKTNENKIKKLEEQMKKNQNDKGTPVKFCPKCGSEEIGVEAEALTPQDFCRACGYNSLKKDITELTHFPAKLKGDKK